MQTNRIVGTFFVVLALFVFMTASSHAEEKATKEECVAKVEEAIALVKAIGPTEALAKIQDKDNGGFVWKDTYVFAFDTNTGAVLAQPINPKHVGNVLTAMKDVKGKMFFAEFVRIANEQGEGWVDYYWPKPGEKEASKKLTFIKKVPTENILFGAGIYE